MLLSKARTYLSLLTVCLHVLLLLSEKCLGATEQTDHLIPVDSKIEPAYRQLLSRKLFITRSNYVRLLVMPSTSEGEFAIAIYSTSKAEKGRSNAQATITCTRAEKNLWYSMFTANAAGTTRPNVHVTRTDAPFSRSAAAAVSNAVQAMIQRSQPPNHALEVLDGTDIEFSVETKRANVLSGLLGPYADGRRARILYEVTKLLSNYCDARPVERERLVRQIERKANQLAKTLADEN